MRLWEGSHTLLGCGFFIFQIEIILVGDKYMKVSCNLVMDTVKIEKEMSRLFVAYLLNVLLYRSHVRW